MFRTRVTELLGIDYPIIQGAMAWVSSPEFIAAVSNAGGMGTLVSATCTDKDEFRDLIKRTKSLTDKTFAVNLSMFAHERPLSNEDIIDVLIEERVKAVETSGVRPPDQYIQILKDGGIKCIHKCTTVKHALSAQKAGADAVTLVGFEQGGAMGPIDVTSMVLIPLAVESLHIPVLAGGGISNARGFAAALALGAEGVVMGTRFLLSSESPVHPGIKEWELSCGIKDTVVIRRNIGAAHRALKNRTVEKIMEMENREAKFEEVIPLISGENTSRLYRDGDIDSGMPFVGQGIELINELKSCKEIIDEMVTGAREIFGELSLLSQ